MINRYTATLGLLIALVTGAGAYLLSTSAPFEALQQQKSANGTQCSGPITATCSWDIKNIPEGTVFDDYYADLEIVDTQDSSTVVGPIPSKIDKKVFSVRFDSEPGKRYACKVTIKLRETSQYGFCYAEPIYYSEPVGLCE